MLLQQFLEKSVPFRRGLRLIHIHHGLEILGFFFIQAKHFYELRNHAGRKLFPFDNVVIVAASLGEPQQRTRSSPSKIRVCLHAGRLVFVQVLAEVCELKYVNNFVHALNVLKI